MTPSKTASAMASAIKDQAKQLQVLRAALDKAHAKISLVNMFMLQCEHKPTRDAFVSLDYPDNPDD